jgi:hypothetical protein
MENGQILLRYPAALKPEQAVRFRDLGPDIRGGKHSYWLTFGHRADWPERLLEVLTQLEELNPYTIKNHTA